MSIITINPYDENVIAEYNELPDKELNKRIEASHKSFQAWRTTSFNYRAGLFIELAELLEKESEELGRLMALEMGKPLKAGIAETRKCASVCRYYAENAETFLKNETIKSDATESYVLYQPLGSILAIMPWNFPFWQVFRFSAPSIMAGNTVLLKHAPNVTGCSLAIEELFKRAGFPDAVFTSLIIGVDKVKQVLEHPYIKGVTLTGSGRAGKSVASLAGSNLKKSILELGGNDPYIVLEDADIEQAAEICVFSRMINSGQTCISAKRFIVMDKVKDQFTGLFLKEFSKIKYGDPLNINTEYGPLARKDLLESLHEQVCESIKSGAKCLTGGKKSHGAGYFYEPTVLVDVTEKMPVFYGETFGPVAAVISVSSHEEAIKVANNSIYGLGGAVFTENMKTASTFAREVNVGAFAVNDYVRSDCRFPFGGINCSGYGRELSHHGIKEFVNVKSIYIK